jgi:metallo-beta-lactamase family protein
MRSGAVQLGFHGGVGTVTGSRFVLTLGMRRVLVDCGLFQGLKQLRLRNRAPFPHKPASIESVVLTHAHLDHSGYLPLLVRDGYDGSVLATPPTADLCGILLPDSGYLQEEEAERANRYGYSRHSPALPLYTRADAERALQHFAPVPFGPTVDAGPATVSFRRAGHIPGAASLLVTCGGRRIFFSGDVGRPDDPLLLPPEPVPEADWMVVESTYGDRLHPAQPPRELLGEVIRRTARRGGTVVIPSFAVGRAQQLLHHVHALRQAGEIPDIPVFLDSPMAADATELVLRTAQEHRLSAAELKAAFGVARITRAVEESRDIDRRGGPMIIISASGMATGGRVLFHLTRFGGDHRNTIVLVGYQAAGTRGATLQAGARELKIHGAIVPIHADVVSLHGMSAHADADELMAWLKTAPRAPRGIFITHGEPAASDALRFRIRNELGWEALVPEQGQVVPL